MRKARYGAALAAVVALTLLLTACSSKKDTTVVDKAKDDGKLTIGIKYDQPGVGLKTPEGTYAGMDVDVAKFIAKELGVSEKDITWKETRSANRESFIQNGTVDLVIASYSINDERKKKVGFAGPYYLAHQDSMVRANDNSIKAFGDLADKRVCQVAGSNSWGNITNGTNKLNQKENVTLVPANSYDECITKLRGNTVDVISTDDTILAGYAARSPQDFKVVGAPFTDERYGIGFKKDQKETCEAVNAAVKKMYDSGAMADIMEKNFGTTNFTFETAQPKPEPCG